MFIECHNESVVNHEEINCAITMSMSSVLSILSMDLCNTESKTTLLEKYLKRIHNTEILRFSFVVGVCVGGGGGGARLFPKYE